MSTILNSSEDDNNKTKNINQSQNTFATLKSNNTMVNEQHQDIDLNLTKKFLTERRGKLKIYFEEKHTHTN